VTVNLNGNPLATHELRTVVPGASAELERVLRRPAAAAATSQGSATTKRRPSYPELVDQFLADKDDSIA
jgi:hypothetical protein